MKNYLSILCSAAVISCSASCQKADEVKVYSTVDNPLKTITVRIANGDTKLALDEETYYTRFQEGDELFGWDATGNYTYYCTNVEGDMAEFELTSEYAPSSEPGTKVNLIYANGYDAEDIDSGSLPLDITSQEAGCFSELPIVMTGQGIVADNGSCEVVFNNETSFISIKGCITPAAGGMSFYSLEATNLYPKMTISISAEGDFVKTIGQAGTITNSAEIVSSQDGKISGCMATFPSPQGAAEASILFTVESAEGIDYYYSAGKKTVPANKIISISGKEFTTEKPADDGIVELVETGETFADFTQAVDAANAYKGACTIKVLKDFTNSEAQTITNTDGVTLNLNGFTLTISGKSTRIAIASGSTLTIDGEGTYTIATSTNLFALTNGNSTLIINGGTIAAGGDYAVVYATKGNFIMNGGTITDNGKSALAIDFEAPAKMELNGGKIVGHSSKHGAVYIGNVNADVKIAGAVISAPYATDNPALNIASGRLVLTSGKIGSSSDRWGVKVGNGSFTMTGGTVSASRYPIYCAGTGAITISGGCVININAGWKTFFASSDAKNSVKLTGGYIYAHHNTSYQDFYTFGGTLTNMSIEVSGGYFAEDISSATAGYNGKITINGTVEDCSGTKDVHGNKYTHQVVPAN